MSVSVHVDPDGDFGVTVITPTTTTHFDDSTAISLPAEFLDIPGLTPTDIDGIRKAGQLCYEHMIADTSARVFCHVARLAGFAWYTF